ncbi:hypothetical protein ACFE04_003112 [Oxalis oulophora]
MASSNRHWPSMFKSKPCNTHHHHQWQHDINPSLISSTGNCHRPSPYASGVEERSPEPKPRWNPKPEQIRLLEAIFNSGMVNPPRDEIRKIRAQLQEFGQVGDANVFYWFQNRKSRSKHKLRHHLQNTKQQQTQTQTQTMITAAPASSSSSSSEKPHTKGSSNKSFSLTSSTDSVNNYAAYYHQTGQQQFLGDHQSFVFPTVASTQGFCFSDPSGHVPVCTSLLLNEKVSMNNKKELHLHDHQEKIALMKMQPQVINNNNYTTTTTTTHMMMTTPTNHGIGPQTSTTPLTTSVTVPSTNCQTQVASPVEADTITRSMVFINDMVFEVPSGAFNVKDAFGEDAVLIHSSGQPVMTNEWGLTLHPLQHGSFYYLI